MFAHLVLERSEVPKLFYSSLNLSYMIHYIYKSNILYIQRQPVSLSNVNFSAEVQYCDSCG